MIDVSNRVLSNIKTYVSDICSNVQGSTSKTPPGFPALGVVQIDNPMSLWIWKTRKMPWNL